MTLDTTMWRRIDAGGHDACRLHGGPDGYVLDGAAVWLAAGGVSSLCYRVECGADWRTRAARIRGFSGEMPIDLAISVDGNGGWQMNGVPIPAVQGMIDIDLGFTPATNILPIRRIVPAEGMLHPAPAAWLDTGDWTLKVLEQTYRRVAADRLAYTAPSFDYAAELTTRPSGLIRSYPGLWEEADGVPS